MVRGTVRNIGSIGSPKPIEAIHVIPSGIPTGTKILLVTEDLTEIDITNLIVSGSYTMGINEEYPGSFFFQIIDPLETIISQIEPFDEVQVYYSTDEIGTFELYFRGKIEKPFRNDAFLNISGKGIGVITVNKYITYSASGKKKSDILKEIVEANFPSINVSNIEENTETRTVSYSEKAFPEIVSDMCGPSHYFYIDQNYNAHYFEIGTRKSETEAIVEDLNHILTENFGPNSESVSTKVRVYGRDVNGVQVFATSDVDTSVTRGFDREFKVIDESVDTSIQAREFSEELFIASNDIPQTGKITSIILPTLLPGEELFIGVPRDGLKPSYYKVQSFEHKFPELQTIITVEKKQFDLAKALNKNHTKSDNLAKITNPFNLDYCDVISFESDSGSHSSTKVENDRLLLQDGAATGQWESATFTLAKQPTALWFLVRGENLTFPDSTNNLRLWYSLDAGSNWNIFNPNTTPVVPFGTFLKVRIVLNSIETRVSSIGLQYSY